MKKTHAHTTGITGILERAKFHNGEIGSYIEHFINERFAYTVRLSNGRIEIPYELAHDQEVMPSSISEEQIQNIASLFRSHLRPIPNAHTSKENKAGKSASAPKPKSLWRKLMKLLGLHSKVLLY